MPYPVIFKKCNLIDYYKNGATKKPVINIKYANVIK
jgi:hypothetical protein